MEIQDIISTAVCGPAPQYSKTVTVTEERGLDSKTFTVKEERGVGGRDGPTVDVALTVTVKEERRLGSCDAPTVAVEDDREKRRMTAKLYREKKKSMSPLAPMTLPFGLKSSAMNSRFSSPVIEILVSRKVGNGQWFNGDNLKKIDQYFSVVDGRD
ncbi:hypothetical protein F0562_035754 [Nyssa sinensis]|uniref:Uncharacterized protein n=1 Tax=Nyssa sinensis TaxID=561372 RepID=A0A5J5ADT1_9ASTE|nr:hypothetical protein F0562_035754 [Nyssa sinensis]